MQVCVSHCVFTTQRPISFCYHTLAPLYHLLYNPLPSGNCHTIISVYGFLFVCLVCSLVVCSVIYRVWLTSYYCWLFLSRSIYCNKWQLFIFSYGWAYSIVYMDHSFFIPSPIKGHLTWVVSMSWPPRTMNAGMWASRWKLRHSQYPAIKCSNTCVKCRRSRRRDKRRKKR